MPFPVSATVRRPRPLAAVVPAFTLAERPESRPVRLKLIDPSESDRRELNRIEQLEIVDQDADLIMVRDSREARLVNASGDLILSDPDVDGTAVWERIRAEV